MERVDEPFRSIALSRASSAHCLSIGETVAPGKSWGFPRHAVLLAALVAASAAAARQPAPAVLILATGGTIASSGDYYRDRGAGTSAITVDELVKSVPGLAKVAALTAEQFSNVGSSAIGPTQWLALSHRITAVFRDRAGLSGVVVTHGTDTMEETAYFL